MMRLLKKNSVPFKRSGFAFGFLVVATLLIASTSLSGIHFVDVAATSGLTAVNTYGGRTQKDFILETTGNGAAIFDYNGDGRNDILITNGTVLKPAEGHKPSFIQLYRNDGGGKFSEVGKDSGSPSKDGGRLCASAITTMMGVRMYSLRITGTTAFTKITGQLFPK